MINLDQDDGVQCNAIGMTLRDYLAAHALALLANDRLLTATDDAFPDLSTKDALAKYAYAIADAMLKAREL